MKRLFASLFATGLISLAPAAVLAGDCIDDPQISGISRTIAVSPADGMRFGRLQYSQTAPLRDKEVILTFDDGPLSPHTNSILNTLDRHCVKATFFAVGRMALYNPGTLKEIARRGHTIATHSWSHPRDMSKMSVEQAKLEIEKGFAAVGHALGAPIAPFFRFPGLNHSPELNEYLISRNISIWSVDVVSGDTNADMTPERLVHDTMARVRSVGRGILLFHDIKKVTAEAIDDIIVRLKLEGYKIVHVVSNTSYIPDPEVVARIDFKQSIRTVAFTGETVDPQVKRDASAIAAPVDYARTEQIVLGSTTKPVKPGAFSPVTRTAGETNGWTDIGERVLGNDVLLSTDGVSSTKSKSRF